MTSSCSSVKKLRSFVLRTTSAAAYFARMTLVRLNDEGFLPLKGMMSISLKLSKSSFFKKKKKNENFYEILVTPHTF